MRAAASAAASIRPTMSHAGREAARDERCERCERQRARQGLCRPHGRRAYDRPRHLIDHRRGDSDGRMTSAIARVAASARPAQHGSRHRRHDASGRSDQRATARHAPSHISNGRRTAMSSARPRPPPLERVALRASKQLRATGACGNVCARAAACEGSLRHPSLATKRLRASQYLKADKSATRESFALCFQQIETDKTGHGSRAERHLCCRPHSGQQSACGAGGAPLSMQDDARPRRGDAERSEGEHRTTRWKRRRRHKTRDVASMASRGPTGSRHGPTRQASGSRERQHACNVRHAACAIARRPAACERLISVFAPTGFSS
jgi:hypothetical protein